MRKKDDVVTNYDAKTLHDALKRKYSSASAIGEMVGKSHSWVSAVLRGSSTNGNGKVSPSELKLLCALAGLEYEDILLPEEEEAEATPVAAPATPQPVAPQPVVINQNIILTDDQYEWVRDAYLQLRKDEQKRHEELMENISNVGRCLVEILNAVKGISRGSV